MQSTVVKVPKFLPNFEITRVQSADWNRFCLGGMP
jgi:hypothetical protein